MAKQFLVWKDRNCNGVNPEWLSLTGEEFYAFIKKEENKNRRFIKMPQIDKGEDEIIIEANEVEYMKWLKEYKRSLYLYETKKNVEVVSVNVFADEDNADLYEKIASDEKSVDKTVEQEMMLGDLQDALVILNKDELKIIELYYFKDLSEREAARVIGVSQQTFHNRKTKILQKLQNNIC